MNIISLIIAALAGIMCAVGIIITANAFKKGKEIYGEYIEPLDEKEFKMMYSLKRERVN